MVYHQKNIGHGLALNRLIYFIDFFTSSHKLLCFVPRNIIIIPPSLSQITSLLMGRLRCVQPLSLSPS